MSDNEHNPDPNTNAARIVSESTGSSELNADIEAAWAEWSKGIQKVDERGMTLLKAAFEAGYEAGAIPDAVAICSSCDSSMKSNTNCDSRPSAFGLSPSWTAPLYRFEQ